MKVRGSGVAKLLLFGCSMVVLISALLASPPEAEKSAAADHGKQAAIFQTSATCMACHNGLFTPSGEDVSIGVNWRSSMMANSSRDPYWQASVRREAIDHPKASAAIEDECAVCHMPMSRYEAKANGDRVVHECAFTMANTAVGPVPA